MTIFDVDIEIKPLTYEIDKLGNNIIIIGVDKQTRKKPIRIKFPRDSLEGITQLLKELDSWRNQFV